MHWGFLIQSHSEILHRAQNYNATTAADTGKKEKTNRPEQINLEMF